MNFLFLVILFGAVCYASSDISIEPLVDHGQWSLPKVVICVLLVLFHQRNTIPTLRFTVIVLKVPPEVRTEEHVPLVCGRDDQTQDVFWKKDGNRSGAGYLKRLGAPE